MSNKKVPAKHNNWAGNYTYRAAKLHRPATVEQLQELVARAGRLKALGSRHSFNDIADSPEEQISLEHFDQVLALDREQRTVTVGGGMAYGQLGRYLQREGFALHNLASLPHISIAGACATGTHGSGDGNGNLATAVAALEMITADGERVGLSRERDGDRFLGAVVGLGALGIVIQVTLDILPAFEMRQDLYENLPLARLDAHFDEILSSAYSVSLFTDWSSERFNQVWLKRRLDDGAPVAPAPEFFGATAAIRQMHPIGGISPVNCTGQMGVPGPWHERLPHFRMDYTPSSGDELQSEYYVGRRDAVAAIRSIDQIRERVAPLLLVSEVRTIAADRFWMSPCHRRASVSLHFTWKQDWPAVQKVLPLIEERLAPLHARPHWGKLFTIPPAHLRSLYARLPDFQQLARELDPRGKFRNPFLDKYIFGEG